MSSVLPTNSMSIHQKLGLSSDKSILGYLCKTVAISGLVIYLLFIFLSNHLGCPDSQLFSPLHPPWSTTSNATQSPTNIHHLMFGLVGSVNAWRHRKAYIESWWRPNVTRGYLYLDVDPTPDLLPWSMSSPPFRVSDDNTKLIEECKHVAPVMVRMVHAILEVFREDHEGVRWYVMGDDDSVFFVDNMVDVLSKYDHNKYVYIGGHSEYILSNHWFSFDQGFGGAGFALSYPLVEALVKSLEECLKRYHYLNSADKILMSCVADFGVSLNAEKGLHQIDLHNDISGFLSSHPQSPLLSLHHFDTVDPIFPSMTRSESGYHLMKAANVDQSRLLQQTICYHKKTNWSFSISWGYSAHIYENSIPRSILKKPIQTFSPWFKVKYEDQPIYMFNTRLPSNDPCEAPHVFFFKSIKKDPRKDVATTYTRFAPRGLPACSSSGNHSADYISTIQVFSSTTKFIETGRSECCDIVRVENTKTVKVKFRTCMRDEIIV